MRLHRPFLPLIWLVLSAAPALAALGVGVGTGKIVIDEILQPGTIYQLPPLTIVNTGDESSRYGLGVSHRENQAELAPQEDWFAFDPSTFTLDPGEAQQVQVTLLLPLKTVPGSYFGFLEGHPESDDASGASVGIAAAAKLYFEVAPASWLAGLYYRLLTFWRSHEPWSSVLTGAVALTLVLTYFAKNFNLHITKKRGAKNE